MRINPSEVRKDQPADKQVEVRASNGAGRTGPTDEFRDGSGCETLDRVARSGGSGQVPALLPVMGTNDRCQAAIDRQDHTGDP
jgi:hypothetical protein